MLKKLLKHKKHVWFSLKEEDEKLFLQFAKDNNCKWVNGKEIDVNNDSCISHMGIDKNLNLGYVSNFCWCIKPKLNTKKVCFSDIKTKL